MSLTITEEVIARQTPEAQGIIRALLAEVKRLTARVAQLESRIAQLEGRRTTPQNSSLPPSTQHPHAKPAAKKPKSKKKRGGQPGHKKHERPLLPTDQCDDMQTLKPAECRRCGEKLFGRDSTPLRHQVWELPEIKPLVTEYQRHRLACDCCGATTCAALPLGVPTGQSGPRLTAFAALLMAYFRQSKRRTAEFLAMLLNQPCSPALAVKMQTQVAAALRPAFEELKARLPTEDCLNIDETPTKEANDKAWLWTFVAKRFTLFAVRPTREATALDELLGDEFNGIVTCDRAKMYWRMRRLQWCWAHLRRDFQALIDDGDARARRLGYLLRASTQRLFDHWGEYRDGRISRAAFVRRVGPVRRRVEKLLLAGSQSGCAFAGMCRQLHDRRDWLWTFLRRDGVEPTNNASERSLRHAVIWRKLSFGTQSASGSRFVETMLSVIETCRQQRRNLFAFVAAAVEANNANRPTPPLLARA